MLYAICEYIDNGYDSDQKQLSKYNIKVGDRFEVEEINMGQSSTSIYLEGFEESFNSVHFRFEDEDGNRINIYDNPRYNPYYYI